MAMYSDLTGAFQQIGELVASVRALHEKIDHRHAIAEKQNDTLHAELRNVKHDLRDLEQKHDSAVHVLTEDFASVKFVQDDIKAAVSELRQPVEELQTLRAKALGAFLVLGPTGGALLYFVPQLVRELWHVFTIWARNGGL